LTYTAGKIFMSAKPQSRSAQALRPAVRCGIGFSRSHHLKTTKPPSGGMEAVYVRPKARRSSDRKSRVTLGPNTRHHP